MSAWDARIILTKKKGNADFRRRYVHERTSRSWYSRQYSGKYNGRIQIILSFRNKEYNKLGEIACIAPFNEEVDMLNEKILDMMDEEEREYMRWVQNK